MGKTGQNCLSVEFKTPRSIADGGRHAAGTLPGANPAFLTTSGGSRLGTRPNWKMSASWHKHGGTINAPHTGAAGGPETQVPLSPDATPADVKIRGGSHPALPPGSAPMLSLMQKSHRHTQTWSLFPLPFRSFIPKPFRTMAHFLLAKNAHGPLSLSPFLKGSAMSAAARLLVERQGKRPH